MKRLFVISDTHRRLIEPPPGFDLAIHLGDWVDYFDALGDNGTRASVYQYRFFEMSKLYDYVLWGNHERMYANQFHIGLGQDELRRRYPAEKILDVEGVRIWLGHSIAQRLPDVDPDSPIPDDRRPELHHSLQSLGCGLVLAGHTHQPRDESFPSSPSPSTGEGRGGGGVMRIVDPGYGQEGRHAIVTIDGEAITVTLMEKSAP